MAATNRAVQSLNYPTKVVFKSSKPAVVMLYSAMLLRKSYGAQVSEQRRELGRRE
jgi:hypothetical protein